MPEDLPVGRGLTIPAGELRERFSRSSGPGGQSVNTTDSRVTLTWDVASTAALGEVRRTRVLDALASRIVDGTLSVSAESERSQLLNRRAARERLAALVLEALAPPRPRRPTRPSKAAKRRRLEDKRRRSETKKLRRERF